MKIIRWLFSHSLFILLIVAVIYTYMFWGNLLGEETPAGKAVAYLSSEFVEVEEFVNAIKAKQAQLSEEHSADQNSLRPEVAAMANTNDTDGTPQQTASIQPLIATGSTESGPVASEEVVVEHKTAVAVNPVEPLPAIEQAVHEPATIEPAVIEPQQVNIGYSQNEKSAKQNAAAIVDAKDEPEQQKLAVAAASPDAATDNKTQSAFDKTGKADAMAESHSYTGKTFVSDEVEKQLDNVDAHGEIIDASQPGGAVREKWITARKSFYQRDYELSEKSYQQVIDSTKDNYDAYGELGNVYFNQGKNRQAASAYFEAAAILVAQGKVGRARSLMGLLRSLDKSKADELEKLIDSTKS